ncbi:MAG TPA: TetR family transcriptional regulator C-terminal domain-containing protein [Tangfeifania sp.]|nr:TetR family transcriptional regulator C-terminal domain-containing protein [Tangfeifania sp.]
MGRKSLKETRQKEIVIAFYKVAKKEGLKNASIAKVAENLKVNPSLIIHYFKTRKELLNSLIDFILKRYLEIYKLNGGADSKEKLVALIDHLFSRNWHRLFDDGVFYSCYALIYRDASVKDRYKKLHDTLIMQFRLSLQEACENHIIEVEDINQTAEVVFSMVDGAYFSLGMESDIVERERKAEIYRCHVKRMLKLTD